MKVTRKGFVFMDYDYDDTFLSKEWQPVWRSYKTDDSHERIFIGEKSIDFDVPDDFDPREKAVAALEEQKRDLAAKYQAAVTEINARISKLQAITYEPEAA